MAEIRLTTEQKDTIQTMGSYSYQRGKDGQFESVLETEEYLPRRNDKTYWFMPYVFEEVENELTFIVHELPESITKQILEFINR